MDQGRFGDGVRRPGRAAAVVRAAPDLGRGLTVCLVATIAIACALLAHAATDRIATELVSMLDHAAIVEQMVRSCRDARPELADAFQAARQAWWGRNAEVRATIDDLKRDPDDARGREFLAYYEAVVLSLRAQMEHQRAQGHTEYAGRCDDVLRDLASGQLDYRPEGEAPS
jgi:hypothetical protein